MSFEMKLKTGFYKTTPYNLNIVKGIIELIPLNQKTRRSIIISEKDLLMIQLKKKKNLEIEFQTRNQVITGILAQKTTSKEVIEQLKEQINMKITYEEE